MLVAKKGVAVTCTRSTVADDEALPTILPHPEDRRKFVLCQNGFARELFCDADQIFNVTSRSCINVEDVALGNSLTKINE